MNERIYVNLLNEKIIACIEKYRELIVYGIVGVLTTIVNWVASYLLKLFLNDQVVWQNLVINAVAWIAAIAFAYPTNRKWVFASRNTNIIKEFTEFAGSRLATGVLETGLMGLLVNAMHIEFWIAKITVSVFVVVANYILSKLFIFKAKE